MNVSMGFVVLMGMGVTFLGLTCIIVLTQLMGKIMTALAKDEPAQKSPSVNAPVAHVAPPDDLTEEVKIAILMALMQQPGFRMDEVTDIVIRKA